MTMDVDVGTSDKDDYESGFEKPSKGSLDYNTPPNQSVARFGESPSSSAERRTNKYVEVQNLPTPITANRRVGGAVVSGLQSPTQRLYPFKEEDEYMENGMHVNGFNRIPTRSTETSTTLTSDFGNSQEQSTLPRLAIPKARKVLGEQNKSESRQIVKPPIRFTSEFKYHDPSSAEIEMKKNACGSTPSKYTTVGIFNDNIRPIDRVVSVPVNKTTIVHEPVQTPATELSIEYDESPTDTLVTYSTDSNTRQKWSIVGEIGHGAFSKVFLCDDYKTAIKVTDLRLLSDPDDIKLRMQNSLTRELDILRELSHPNIVHLIGSEVLHTPSGDVERVKMAINYASGGDLYDLVTRCRQDMSPQLIGAIFAQVVNAIHYIHSKGVCHRDIKLENILLLLPPVDMINGRALDMAKNGDPILILSDFGLSKKLSTENELLTTRCGSEDYVSPELLLGMKYDGKQNDCWSLGVVLYTILEARLPFDPLPSETNTNSRRSKPSHRIAMIAWHWYYMKGEEMNAKWGAPKEITKMLLAKRNKRASIETIWNHPWVHQFFAQ